MTKPPAISDPVHQVNRAAAIIAECRLLATMTEEPGRITRRFLTAPVADVHARLRSSMERMGMTVTVDALGNLRGLYAPPNAPPARLLLGSHIDTVPNAGAFDGVLGVVMAIEWVSLAQQEQLPLSLEVIAFSEEEGVRFGVPFLGSRALAGAFTPDMLCLIDAEGNTVENVIRSFQLAAEQIPQAALKESVAGFIEIHIEQGPILDSENLPLASVLGINGQSRLAFNFSGQANHAGTTPMALRRDPLTAAAEWMLAVEAGARETFGLVATVGKVSVEPNAVNVIPGQVEVSLDVRHPDDLERKDAVHKFQQLAEQIATSRGVAVNSTLTLSQPSVPMNPTLTATLLASIEDAGYAPKTMYSGAGHDAMIMASCVPSAMLFLRSPGGISHHPDESVLQEDVHAAMKVGLTFLRKMSG